MGWMNNVNEKSRRTSAFVISLSNGDLLLVLKFLIFFLFFQNHIPLVNYILNVLKYIETAIDDVLCMLLLYFGYYFLYL